jgi:hypothetical protein
MIHAIPVVKKTPSLRFSLSRQAYQTRGWFIELRTSAVDKGEIPSLSRVLEV